MFGEHLADNVLKLMNDLNKSMNPHTTTDLSAEFSKQIEQIRTLSSSSVNWEELEKNLEALIKELKQ